MVNDPLPTPKQTDPQAQIRRAGAERKFVLLIDALAVELQEKIRVLSDNRLAGKSGADFLIQVDDYEFRVELIDAPDNLLMLTKERLQASVRLLEDNPNTLALIYAWTTEDIRAVPFSFARIQYLLQNPDRIASLVRQARPLQDVVRDVIQRQIKIWDVNLENTQLATDPAVDVLQIFFEEIGKAIDKEMNRSYRNEERSQAAKTYPYQQEKQFLVSVLEDALQGADVNQLIDKLVHVTPRGMR